MVSTNAHDPYVDPETGVLINKVYATSREELAQIESDLVTVRTLELFENPPKPTADLEELASIHEQLFQDVYSWAGAIRTVDVRKNEDEADAFAHFGLISVNAV